MSWTDETHGNKAEPNYNVVFPDDAVNTLTITIAPDDWAAMQADLEEMFAKSLWVRKEIIKAGSGLSEDKRTELMNQLLASKAQTKDARAAADSQPVEDLSDRSPMWTPATIAFQGQEWKHVGVRYKGDFSLRRPWLLGEMRLPFKFDFDQFEDDYPEIKNQRFFGFKELSLANNFQDPAGMRDTLVYEILKQAGLPSLRTAPYELVLDHGEGPLRLGLYTVVEVIDDTGIASYFGSDDGNIYEGDGAGASLALESADQIEASFQKKNNEKKGDWSDVHALYDVLHDRIRLSDPAAWRARLEAIFDVGGFLEWLGIAAYVGHIDTYGFTPHNFYLYNNPETGRLTWFSWDHNMTFGEESQTVFALDRAYVPNAWPLIRFLLDDPVYWDRYVKLLAKNARTVLAPDALIARIRARAAVIAPVATKDMSREAYDAAVQAIIDYVERSAEEVKALLQNETAKGRAT